MQEIYIWDLSDPSILATATSQIQKFCSSGKTDNLSLISLGNKSQPTPHPFPSFKASLNELCTQESLGPFTFCAEADILIIKPPRAWCRVVAPFKATEMFCSAG